MIILAIICWVMSVAIMAIMDVLAFKFKHSKFKSLNANWWSPNTSWRNQYLHKIPGKGPKFPGSTTFFRFTTDAWSLMQALSTSLVILGIIFAMSEYYDISLLWSIGIFLIFRMTWVGVYHSVTHLVKTNKS